jgi:hypothetical protein
MVTMNKYAFTFQHISLTLPASATTAKVGWLNSKPLNGFQQAFMFTHLDREARLGQPNPKGFAMLWG